MVLDAFAEKLARRESWIDRVEVYQAHESSLYVPVAELIAEAGFAAARIGFEQDGLSASHWHEIQRALPRLEMIDCSRMMDEVRWIKTAAEVDQQKRAADLLDDGLEERFPTIREGETEREVHARVLAACTRRGAGYVHGILNSSSNDVMYGGESDICFRNGDFVRNDYVAYFNGCPGHQSRLAILGRPRAEQMRGYHLTLEIHRKTIDRCRAGVTAGEIYEFAKAEFKRRASTTRHRWLDTGWDHGFTSRSRCCARTAILCWKKHDPGRRTVAPPLASTGPHSGWRGATPTHFG